MTAVVRSVIVGCGGYLPERVLTNRELAERIDTSDEWIVARSGIRERRIAAEGETTSQLALRAADRALRSAGLAADAVDLIVLATATPDLTFPATATRVQAGLGIKKGLAFDLQAVCSGFVYALAVADNFIRLGQASCALVIGAETFSRILDWTDRSTCVLFGDGAGAVVLRAATGRGDNSDRGILATKLHADGCQHDLLYVDGGPSTTQTTGHLRMSGREVFRHAVSNLAGAIDDVLTETGVAPTNVDWLVPHQANLRILEATAKRVQIPRDRVVVTIDRHGNTSAASVPLALAEAADDGRIRAGHLVLMEAMGGGFTWGACLVRW